MAKAPQHLTPKPPNISEDTLRQMVQAQAGEQALRSQELAIRKSEIDYQSKHASDILGAQERDRDKHRAWLRTNKRDSYLFAFSCAIVLIPFICYCLYLGKDQIAQDVVKFGLGCLVGGLGGYGLRASGAKRKPNQEED